MNIWTEEENELRQLDNLINRKNETCKTCQWSNWEKGDTFLTCGHHLQNFTPASYCGYYTDRKDPKVLNYFKKRKEELRKKSGH